MKRPDYGVDAPGVIRTLLLVAAAGFLIWMTRLGLVVRQPRVYVKVGGIGDWVGVSGDRDVRVATSRYARGAQGVTLHHKDTKDTKKAFVLFVSLW